MAKRRKSEKLRRLLLAQPTWSLRHKAAGGGRSGAAERGHRGGIHIPTTHDIGGGGN